MVVGAVTVGGIAQATLTPGLQRGTRIVQLEVPGKRAEICIVPSKFPGADYSAKDLEHEEQLCSFNGHANTAVCPKFESTNPGLNFHSIPEGMTKEQVESRNCEVIDPKTKKDLSKKLAKYKLSTSCSYTPSIVGYYHMSRILGGVANVPQAVLRTYDLEKHIELGQLALSTLSRSGKSGELIGQTWSGLVSNLRAGGSGSRKALLLTDDFDQSYGALQRNPRGEERYKEFFNGGSTSNERNANFRDRSSIFALVKSSRPAEALVGREFTAENVQKMVQMKDAADMVVLDTVLGQQDRFGNIHAVVRHYYIDGAEKDANGNAKVKSKDDLKPKEIASLRAVPAKQMMLKDNDCGVAKTNVTKAERLIDGVAHISPETYKRLQALNAIADQEQVKRFFRIETMFTEADWKNVRGNLNEVAKKLEDACAAGRLKLDLDINAHFSNGPMPQVSCD